jgi:hypothetical protein
MTQGDIASLIHTGAEIFEAKLNLATGEFGLWVPVVERSRYGLVVYYLGTTELPSQGKMRDVAALAREHFLATFPYLSSMTFDEAWGDGGQWTRFDVDWWGVAHTFFLVALLFASLRTLPWLLIAVHRARAWPIRRRIARGQCAFCGYDLAGTSDGICPECGRDRALNSCLAKN